MRSSVHIFKTTETIAWLACGMAFIFPVLAYAVCQESWPGYAGWIALSVFLGMAVVTAAALRQSVFGRLVFDEYRRTIEQRGASPFRLQFSTVARVEVSADIQGDDPPYGSVRIIGSSGEAYRIRDEFFGTASQTIAIIQLASILFPDKVHET